MKLAAIMRRMLSMCPEAWYIFIRSVQLCVFLLLCAVVLLIGRQNGAEYGHRLYMTANALNETAQALLLIGVLGSALIEDAQS